MGVLSWVNRSSRLCRWLARGVGVRLHHPVEAMGLRFANPVGLAAGLDKDGEAVDALGALGFGFVEVGTATALAQPGNPRPRLFRLKKDRALLNRMGFNNHGASAMAQRLAWRFSRRLPSGADQGIAAGVVVGVNIGKSKVTPEDQALGDYVASTGLLAPLADYLVVNVSSPNTPGLRNLQAVSKLAPLLVAVRAEADRVCPDRTVPLLVKIAPDLSDDDVDAVAAMALELGLHGIVATNTTLSREGLVTDAATVEQLGAGGISGAPLAARSLDVLKRLREQVGPDMTLISVGGIGSGSDVAQRLAAGADLVQVYSAFVYQGPGLLRDVARSLGSTAGRRPPVDGLGSLE